MGNYGNRRKPAHPKPKAAKKSSKEKPPKGYDSWFEYNLHQEPLKHCVCHTETVEYTQVKRYEPDFIFHEGSLKIYIEAKGRFRDRAEARKYVDVKLGLKTKEELVFIFYNPKTPMPGARSRADGTKLTHGAWADLQGFRHFTEETVPASWGTT